MSITVKGRAFSDAVIQRLISRFLSSEGPQTRKTMIDLISELDVSEDVLERITDDELARFDPQTSTYVVETQDPQTPINNAQHCNSTPATVAIRNNHSTSPANEDRTNIEQNQTHAHIVGLSRSGHRFYHPKQRREEPSMRGKKPCSPPEGGA